MATRGQRRYGPEYVVVIPREADLVRDERPLPLTEVSLPPPAPDLTPSLPGPELGPEVETPTGGGAPSGEIREEPTVPEPVALPVELSSPPVSALLPLKRGQRTRQPPVPPGLYM